MLQPNDLLNALARWQAAQKHRDSVISQPSGIWSWSSNWAELDPMVNKAEEEFTAIFNTLVDERVNQILHRRFSNE